MKRTARGLGSGLDALMPGDSHQMVRQVRTDRIQPNSRQPRTVFDEQALADLTASVREHGIIQPLIVSSREDGYELVAGERRWRAAQRAGIELVPVIVRETTSQQLLELAIIENVQRADLNPIEEAYAYQALKDEFQLSDEQIAQRVGKNNRVTVTNTRRLLKLPPAAQAALSAGQLSAGHGRALLKIEAGDEQQAALDLMLREDLTVREAEKLGDLVTQQLFAVEDAFATIRGQPTSRSLAPRNEQRTASEREPGRPRSTAGLEADDREVARTLEQILGTPVSVNRTERDLRVTIVFHTDELLNQFFDKLNS
jgi:ParB family transcriptional regulator, chromosome partitioning protein